MLSALKSVRNRVSLVGGVKLYFLVLVLFVAVMPSFAQSEISTTIEGFFTEVEGVLRVVAGLSAVIGLLGLAILNMGSVFPFVAEFKAENPKAARNIMTGLIILFMVGSGAFAIFLGDLA